MAGIGVPAQAVLVPWTMLGCSEGSGTTISKLTPASAAVYSEPAGAPDVTGKVPSLGWPLRTNRMNWMGDFLDLSKIPRPVPFFWYHDAAKGIVAPVQNGKPVQHYVPLDPWGSPGITYHTTPILRNGRIERYDPRHGDVLFADEALYTAKGNIVSREGIRGECYLAPYVTWVAHPTLDPAGNPIPRSPFAIGVSVDGVIYAEYIWLEAKSLRLGKVQNVNGCLDLAFFPPNRKIFFVTDQSRAGRGRIIRVDRTPAIGSTRNSGTEDGAPWKQSDLVSGVGNITSLVCTDDGMLYATDNTNGGDPQDNCGRSDDDTRADSAGVLDSAHPGRAAGRSVSGLEHSPLRTRRFDAAADQAGRNRAVPIRRARRRSVRDLRRSRSHPVLQLPHG